MRVRQHWCPRRGEPRNNPLLNLPARADEVDRHYAVQCEVFASKNNMSSLRRRAAGPVTVAVNEGARREPRGDGESGRER